MSVRRNRTRGHVGKVTWGHGDEDAVKKWDESIEYGVSSIGGYADTGGGPGWQVAGKSN